MIENPNETELEGETGSPEMPETSMPELPEPPTESPAEKTRPSAFVRFLRAALIYLIVFGLGAVLVIFTLYFPLRRELNAARADLVTNTQKIEKELNAAKQDLESMAVLEKNNTELQSQLRDANIHIALLQARLDISLAQIAMLEENTGKAKLALSKTHQTLDLLKNQLDQDQRQVVEEIQDRLKLVLGEIDDNVYAAQSDLDVMMASLIELENALIR